MKLGNQYPSNVLILQNLMRKPLSSLRTAVRGISVFRLSTLVRYYKSNLLPGFARLTLGSVFLLLILALMGRRNRRDPCAAPVLILFLDVFG